MQPPAFTLEQLILANQLLFPDTFRTLAKKHLGEDWFVHSMNYRASHGDLFEYINNYCSRANTEDLINLSNLIREVIS